MNTSLLRRSTAMLALLLPASAAFAHGVTGGDAAFLQSVTGTQVFPLMYLGAKHMVTGYDHLLFLAGVIFFLYRLKDVALYATLFAGIRANPYIVDAIIGLSVVYKALENMGALRRLGLHIDPRAAVFAFGLAHGFGLSTKLQDFALSKEGLVGNILSFNVGVELGQIAALAAILLAFRLWRRSGSFERGAWLANVAILAAGFTLTGYQVAGYLTA